MSSGEEEDGDAPANTDKANVAASLLKVRKECLMFNYLLGLLQLLAFYTYGRPF